MNICDRKDHIVIDIEKCPRCGDEHGWIITESVQVSDYCEKHHAIDTFECIRCYAAIDLDFFSRLLSAEKKLEKILKENKGA